MYRVIKRGLDILLSLLGLIVLAPAMLVVSIAVKATSPGPVLFRQRRFGIHKTYFNILKFRTMRTDSPKDCPTHLLKHPEQYITPVGSFLRKTSLDELPQLFNILVGDMSVVGPRPVVWSETDRIILRDEYGANDVRPGLTGWAQINGRDGLSTEIMAKLDGEYADNMSLWMDLRCFFKTLPCVLRCQGVIEGGTGALEYTLDTEETPADQRTGAKMEKSYAHSAARPVENDFATSRQTTQPTSDQRVH